MPDDVIICGNFIRNVFEITKIQTENNIFVTSFRDVKTSKYLKAVNHPDNSGGLQ